MSRAIRQLVACVLLVLLPFQALAAGYAMAGAPIVTCAEQMMAGMDCCDDDSSACPAAGDCAVHAAIALPIQASAPAAFPGQGAAIAPVPTLHESYIPDGLQRPPQSPV